ncbi:hypothetical protein Hanom_Chr09g00839491 [Helianthus anomalus]
MLSINVHHRRQYFLTQLISDNYHHPRHYLPPPPSSSSATTPITSTSTNHLASPDSSLPLPKVVDEADDGRSGACIQLSKLR